MSGTKYIASNWRVPENSNSSKNDNYSLNFDGSSDNIDLGSGLDIFQYNIGQSYTVSLWYKSTTSTSFDTIVNFGSNTYKFSLVTGLNGTISFGAGNSTSITYVNKWLPTSGVINDGNWHHICIVQDSTFNIVNLTAYVDGSSSGSSPSSTSALVETNNRIGDGYYSGFEGDISEVAVFDYALSVPQIESLVGRTEVGAGNPMVLKPTPVAYYPLGDNSSGGIDVGPISILTQPNVSVDDASVFDFNGTSQSIEIANNSSLENNFITLSLWYYQDSGFNTFDYLFAKKYSGGGGSYAFYFASSNTLVFNIRNTSGLNSQTPNSTTLTTGWHHIVGTYDGTTIKLYIDGGLNQSKSDSTTIAYADFGAKIGGFPGTTSYGPPTQISNVSIFSQALPLTGTESVESLYNYGAPPNISSYSNLKAWYKLDQSANWEADTVGNWQIPNNRSAYPQSLNFVRKSSADYNTFQINNSPFNYPTGKVSASIWFQWNGFSAFQTMIADDYGTGSNRMWTLLSDTSDKVRFWIFDSGGNVGEALSTTVLETGKWYHAVGTYDGTTNAGAVKLYINGQLEDQVATVAGGLQTVSPSAAYRPQIGHISRRSTAGSPWGSSATPGKLSNACIWDTGLEDADVEALYNDGVPATTKIQSANLLGWWPLDNSGTWRGTLWNGSVVDSWIYEDLDITASTTESLQFSGGYQNPPASYEGWVPTTVTVSGSLMLSFWVKGIGLPSYPYYFDTRFVYLASGFVTVQGDASSSYVRVAQYKNDYAWHHYAIYIPSTPSFSGNDIRFWIDGVEDTDKAVIGTAFSAKTEIRACGTGGAPSGKGNAWSNWAYFENFTPSDENIATLYNGGTPGDLSSLNPSVWYKLDSTDITFNTSGAYELQIQDSSTNNNNATGPYDWGNTITTRPRILTDPVKAGSIVSIDMTEQSLVNNNVSTLNGESSAMTSANLVLSDLTRNLPYENYSLDLDGTEEINCGDITTLNGASKLTFNVWVKYSSNLAFQIILGESITNTATDAFQLYNWTSGILYCWIKTGGTGTVSFVSNFSSLVNIDEWHMLTLVYDGTQASNNDRLSIHLDGDSTNIIDNYGTIPTTYPNISDDFYIGKGFNGGFNGKMSNVSIFNKILTLTEIQKLYANGLPQDLTSFTPQPSHWWTLGKESFWNGSDWIVRDMIGSNDGTSSNMEVSDLVGDAPRSEANGTGTNMDIPTNLVGNAGFSDKNAYSINMGPSARVTDTP